MHRLKGLNNLVEYALKCMDDCLKSDKKISALDGDYELEFYLNNSLEGSLKVKNSEEIISGCLNIYEKFLYDKINEETYRGFKKAIENPMSRRVLHAPGGIIVVRVVNEDVSFNKWYTLEIFIYKKEKLENEVCEYISNKNLIGEQKEYILDMFKENRVYSKNLDCILESLKDDIIDLIPEDILKDLIRDKGYTIVDVINNDLSQDILSLINKDSEIYRIYKDVISVIKIENGYAITFCGDIIHKIEYKLELTI